MKKKIIILISIIVTIIIIVIGYFSIKQFNSIKSELANKAEDKTIFNKDFGSYELPKNNS